VVDSNDPSRFDECALELDKLLRDDHLRDCPLLVLANKQDLPGARSIAELADALKLHSQRGRQWFVQGTAATSGEGIYEGLDWLATILKKKG
jgi:signal recognition particle receptor subunit beta